MYYKNSMRISYHCWTESLVDLQEGQLMLQYYYVSNSNKHVNKKGEEEWRTNDYLTLLTVVFAHLQLIVVEPMFTFRLQFQYMLLQSAKNIETSDHGISTV